MSFLELPQEPGVYSRVTAGMSIRNSSLFIEVSLMSIYDGHIGKLNYSLKESIDASGGDPGGQASLISWQSYIGIPINFIEVSGIVTF